jgi:hypothetical protein
LLLTHVDDIPANAVEGGGHDRVRLLSVSYVDSSRRRADFAHRAVDMHTFQQRNSSSSIRECRSGLSAADFDEAPPGPSPDAPANVPLLKESSEECARAWIFKTGKSRHRCQTDTDALVVYCGIVNRRNSLALAEIFQRF